MSLPSSPLTVSAFLAAVEAEVIEADARFQVLQASAWHDASRDRPLLAGYDRLTNLGLTQLTVSVALEPVRVGLLRRFFNWLLGTTPEARFRLWSGDDTKAPLRLAVAFGRDEQGRWKGRVMAPAWAGALPSAER
jgi:hypothetical protein